MDHAFELHTVIGDESPAASLLYIDFLSLFLTDLKDHNPVCDERRCGEHHTS